ncbi:Glyoxylase, beta-lactamase superfamily II [Cnuella takakiae]|uniref:Glyoxylase, beta-lactamase superfamily II n=1 Tax=Cnuella takakiae TaxID=1302690 RepID=A0A1M4SG10_9BACT|nr:MBL fold metallo-hydrolase [Cnuella takakiae]OLY94496.1 MBL fold metallo-hydrolase [Cnuella takakiae]SHE31125.1 Glyoxylase, beta-lactamase superfamily II [Cnuella takakiae]
MKIEQIYTGCLAQGAYYIESEGEAVVIDPLREVEPYLQKAEKAGAKIKYVFETHFHADFVSGHVDLSKQAGAPIVYGPNANPTFDAIIAEDGQEFKVGKVTFKVLHTPGHTMESTCYLLKDESGKNVALFSGDTLFIGDVGRPDLAQKAASMTQEDLAGTLFDSLRNKVMTLADDIIVYPAHGAGSACGKNMSKETSDTLGNQKKTNYALRANMTREEFIKEVTDGLATPPAYFPLNVMLNKQGYESITEVMQRGNQALSPDAFEAAANETGAVILDTRDPQTFAKGFIPNSINIGIDGSFAPWVGALIPDIKQQILLVTDEGREEEVITRLARVGYDYTIGYLKGGFNVWKEAGKEVDQINSIDATELAQKLKEEKIKVLDVRKPGEYISEHVDGALNLPLDNINDHLAQLDKDHSYFVHCAGGYRSMIFNSILKARGFDNLVDIKGGFKAIKDAGSIPVSDYVCPSTLK